MPPDFCALLTLRKLGFFFVFVTSFVTLRLRVFVVAWLRLVRLVEVALGRVRPREEGAEGDVLRAAGRRGARREFI